MIWCYTNSNLLVGGMVVLHTYTNTLTLGILGLSGNGKNNYQRTTSKTSPRGLIYIPYNDTNKFAIPKHTRVNTMLRLMIDKCESRCNMYTKTTNRTRTTENSVSIKGSDITNTVIWCYTNSNLLVDVIDDGWLWLFVLYIRAFWVREPDINTLDILGT